MERFLYTAMGGALHTLTAQRIHANNLANAGTTGFRADLEQVAAYQVQGPGFASNVLAQEQDPTTDFTPGHLETTGRDLDVAIRGAGFLSVQAANGKEAYTRAGNLQVDADGQLLADGRPVLGVGGPIQVPDYQSITLGQDGTVSVVPVGGNATLQLGQLKLVNPAIQGLAKGEDGLFHLKAGGQAPQDPNVVLEPGHLEASNVNAVDEMVNTLSLSRTFEVQIRMMKTADELSAAGSRLVRGA
ncbi:flagellar basal-body rod protein FlgF [Gallaecimonas kandeliae]|uniref:flagellar basal-body rod protein FlgF n=1 Tax=Gallaecimonas kandeliae TaxID=3029055 RepID=UPI00264793D2|nr:flagellar basal-body rod protein FlgF [Gallaecimonas kandeliae]WKE66532.1 flagellar basal-body rod protein FlgF [Gallaecimonas kandeliae]